MNTEEKICIVLDTNVVMQSLKNEKFQRFFEDNYPFERYQFLLPFAVEAELRSFVLRYNWGEKKKAFLERFLAKLVSIQEARREMIDAYALLDAFSLGQHPTEKRGKNQPAHRMGKNDLWIAAIAYLHKAPLITTDRDFLQFNARFFEVRWINPEDFR